MLRLIKWLWRLIKYFLLLLLLSALSHAVIVHTFLFSHSFSMVIPLSSIKPGAMQQGGGCVGLTGLSGFDLKPLLLHLGNVIPTCPSLSISLAIPHGPCKEIHVLWSIGKHVRRFLWMAEVTWTLSRSLTQRTLQTVKCLSWGLSVGAQRRALSRTSATLGPVPFLCRVRPLVSPHEGSSSDWSGYDDIDDDVTCSSLKWLRIK